jgi:hypothetical protein
MAMLTKKPDGFIDNSKGNTTAYDNCNLSAWYPGEVTLETLLVLLAVICIPWMLLVRPLILRHRNKKAVAEAAHSSHHTAAVDNHAYATHNDDDDVAAPIKSARTDSGLGEVTGDSSPSESSGSVPKKRAGGGDGHGVRAHT